ncbi:MAG: hypothetical protein FWB90_03375 [Fibromonadales bacterium]|nr:hypothetical protein [Fibromonadales bacterium]
MLRLIIVISVIILVSCAGKEPQPQVQPQAQIELQAQSPIIVRDTVHRFRTDTLKITVKETESLRAMQKSIDSLLAGRETAKAIDMLKLYVQQHSNLDRLGFRTLQLAGLLNQTGQGAEALAVLEGFAVYKPAINFWIDSANTMYDRISGTNKNFVEIDPARQENINALVVQIRNLKNTNANPAQIIFFADSLRSLAPSDSILIWLEKQLPSQTESSNAFCEEQRKVAAEKFDASRKNKARANALLGEAIDALDKCLARTPSTEMRKKVQQNKDTLEKQKQ